MKKNKEKLKAMITVICNEHNNGDLTQLKLWKLLFFCEANFFSNNQRTISGVDYQKNHHGPTPNFNVGTEVISELISERVISIDKTNKHELYLPGEDANRESIISLLDGEEYKCIRDTCEAYGKQTAWNLRVLSHHDPIWLGAEQLQDILDFSFVAYRQEEEEADVTDEACETNGDLSSKALENLARILQ